MTGAADCTRDPGEDVGTYQITCTPGDLAAQNYVFVTGNSADFDIDPAELTITAEDQVKGFGATFIFDTTSPSDDFSVVGLVNADSVTSVSLTSDGAPASATAAGNPYDIVVSGAVGIGLGNYDIDYVYGNLVVQPYQVLGFSQPVDNLPMLNSAKAGQAIPLKFRVLDYLGNPVNSLPYFGTLSGSMTCGGNAPADLLEEYASGSSGLQNFGNGYYQFNWKTPTNYANSCRTFAVNLFDGASTHLQANFQFKK